MRILLAGVAAIALSGCSFLGLGGNQDYKDYGYNAQTGNYGYQAQPVAPKACQGGQCLSRWNLEGAIGPSFAVGGSAVTGGKLNPRPRTEIRNLDNNDIFDTGYRAELGGSYALSPNRKITGNAFVENANGGDVVDWGTLNGASLQGGLSDYETYGAEIGVRQYFAPRKGLILKSVRPYVEGKLGAAHLDDITLNNVTTSAGAVVNNVADLPFYEGGWVPTAAGMIGFETPVAKYTTIGLETGLRYTGVPKTDTSAIRPGTALSGANNGGARYSVPVMLRGRYRF